MGTVLKRETDISVSRWMSSPQRWNFMDFTLPVISDERIIVVDTCNIGVVDYTMFFKVKHI